MIKAAENRKVYTMKEISQLLGVNIKRIYQMAKDNEFPCVRVGRQYLAPKRAFHEWFNHWAD